MFNLEVDLSDFNKKTKYIDSNYKRTVSEALLDSGLLVQNKSKELSPYLTGEMSNSITHDPILPLKDIEVGSSLTYAKINEYKNRRKPKGYLRPALNNNFDRIQKIFEKAFNRLYS